MTAELVPVSTGRLPLSWEFKLVAPLANFRYSLFEVTQRAFYFPVDIVLYGADERRWQCHDEEAFERAIEAVLGSDETRRALASIRAIDRLQGRRWLDVVYQDVHGRQEVGVALEPLPRSSDGTLYHAKVITPRQDVILEARVSVSGSAEAAHSEEVLDRGITKAIEELLGRGVHRELGGAFPRVQVRADGIQVSGDDGLAFSIAI